jgi:hypothetical protein
VGVGFEPWEVLAVWGIVTKHSTTGCPAGFLLLHIGCMFECGSNRT